MLWHSAYNFYNWYRYFHFYNIQRVLTNICKLYSKQAVRTWPDNRQNSSDIIDSEKNIVSETDQMSQENNVKQQQKIYAVTLFPKQTCYHILAACFKENHWFKTT